MNIDIGTPDTVDAPLAAIRPSTLSLFSQLLNPTKVIPTECGTPRDWRGLAELSGVSSEKLSFLETKDDPVKELVKMWCQSNDSGCKYFSDLKAFLAIIDRFDVVDDSKPFIESDVEAYREKSKNRGHDKDTVVSPVDPSAERNILTLEDSERNHKGLPLTKYDAFILFADEDSEFASLVVETLETEYKLKLCIKDRDLLPGVMFEHEIIGRLIAERCNRLLIIFSPSFLKSKANQFLVSYAQAFALESQQRKIVPCMYQECELPPSVRYSFCIRYSRAGKLWNFWDKLSQSLQTTSSTASSSSSILVKDAFTRPSFDMEKAYCDTKVDAMATQDYLSKASSDYWDPEKPTKLSSSYSKSKEKQNHSNEENHSDNQSLPETDTYSVNSDAHLLAKSSSSKWYKKIINPIKPKRSKSRSKQKEVAE